MLVSDTALFNESAVSSPDVCRVECRSNSVPGGKQGVVALAPYMQRRSVHKVTFLSSIDRGIMSTPASSFAALLNKGFTKSGRESRYSHMQ
mmetsp:Transcript_26617/g.34103  ORF Transcript_26617/g.34103 Transcript_26617/m.34103 type:complete len:91 (-) Transcript_26617:1135-1407(-)